MCVFAREKFQWNLFGMQEITVFKIDFEFNFTFVITIIVISRAISERKKKTFQIIIDVSNRTLCVFKQFSTEFKFNIFN